MKKLIAIVTLVVCLLFCSCGTEMESVPGDSKSSMFVIIEHVNDLHQIVYHKETKVMYSISIGPYNRGTFTALLNPDGTPMLYRGAE